MDHNQKHSKGFLTRINTTQEWEENMRKFQWQKCSSRTAQLLFDTENLLTWRLVDVSWFSSLYKRCVFSRGTFLWLKLSLYLPHSWVVLILVRKPLECFWLWSMVLLAYLSDDSLMWADFQYQTRVELFERNIFVIETFAYSPLIPELYWFSWESLWSIFDYDPWSF